MLPVFTLLVLHMSLWIDTTSGFRQQIPHVGQGLSENATLETEALPAELQAQLQQPVHHHQQEFVLQEQGPSPKPPPPKPSAELVASRLSSLLSQRQRLLLRLRVASDADFVTKLLTEPDFVALVLYMAVFIFGAFKVWVHSGSDTAEAAMEVRDQRDALQGAYLNSVAEIEGILAGMSESSAYLAEWNFEEKRSKFEKFMERIRDKPDNFTDTRDVAVAVVEPFRTYITMWLSVYQQCTLDPLNRPKVIVEEDDLKKCRNLRDLAGLVADRLGKNSVTFIRAWVEKVRKQGYSVSPDKLKDSRWFEFGPCGFGVQRGDPQPDARNDDDDDDEADEVISALSDAANERNQAGAAGASSPPSRYPIDLRLGLVRVCVLSQNHAFLLIAFGLSLLVSLSQVVLGHFAIVAIVFATQCALAYILYRIDEFEEVARLQQEVNRLLRLSSEVRNNHDQLKDFYGRLRKLGHLWRYRTLPCLEHFHELHLALLNMKGPEKVAFLQAINDTWTPQLEGLGDVNDWMGEDSISEEFLKLASSQLNQATEYVVKHRDDENASSLVLSRVDQAFGFLVVRVLAAYSLTNKGPFGQLSNPYVVLSVNQKGGKAIWKTKAVSSDLNPRWGEEYFIPVGWSANLLELHVKDDQRSEDDPSIGYLNVMFRNNVVGQWHRKREHLFSMKKQTQKQSEILYEVFFASEVRQLRKLDAS